MRQVERVIDSALDHLGLVRKKDPNLLIRPIRVQPHKPVFSRCNQPGFMAELRGHTHSRGPSTISRTWKAENFKDVVGDLDQTAAQGEPTSKFPNHWRSYTGHLNQK